MASVADRQSRPDFVAGFLHPCRDVSLPVQHPPNVNVIRALDIENELGIAGQRPKAQPRDIHFLSVPQRSGTCMPADVDIGLLQCVDESERCRFGVLAQIVRDDLVHIPVRQLSRDDGFVRRPQARDLEALRTRRRRLAK